MSGNRNRTLKNPSVFISKPIPEVIVSLLKEHGFEVKVNNTSHKLSKSALIDACQQADYLLNVGMSALDKEFLQACKHLKGIALCSVGFDHIDLETASQYNIPVSNTPDVLSKATADTAFLLLLSVSRKSYFRSREIERGEWKNFEYMHQLGRDIQGDTLGIFGLGRIGFEMAKMARAAYGMRIIYHNRSRNPEAEDKLEAEYVSFEELLKRSDVISVHTNLTPDTQYRFDKVAFSKMKKNAIFINTARGKIHNETDLTKALIDKEIWGAGLDVTDPEPMLPDNPLLQMSNVCVLPHIGSATLETRTAMAEMAVRNLIAVSKNEQMPQIINKEFYSKSGAL
ncbi:D-glycerate dehydrogenase [Robertkochia solimangrovi]|nr:D-glycerate dehydrogenase [Robertkochia solimangrovi]